jgi:hypothetical protein
MRMLPFLISSEKNKRLVRAILSMANSKEKDNFVTLRS